MYGVELYRRKRLIDEAHRFAREQEKLVLNVGCCGSPFTREDWVQRAGDVNCDKVCPRNGEVKSCEVCDVYALPYGDKQFGAVICSHVLEHLDRPRDALLELERVSDGVFVVTPLPIALQNWLFPEHKWIFWRNGNPDSAWKIR